MLEVRQLRKTYSVVPVLRDVTFALKPGEIVGYLGANGAGKTTTVQILVGLLEPSGGQVFFEGRDVREDALSFRRRLGYVPEASSLYPFLSGLEYLMLVGRLRCLAEAPLRRRATELLELFGLRAAANLPIAAYSKGMRQRTLLSAALLHNPDLLILDEPLSGLDVATVLIMKHLVRMLADRGRIVLYSSHLLDVVEKLCTRVIVLHDGRIVADDSVDNLRTLQQCSSLESAFASLVEDEDSHRIAEGILETVDAPVC